MTQTDPTEGATGSDTVARLRRRVAGCRKRMRRWVRVTEGLRDDWSASKARATADERELRKAQRRLTDSALATREAAELLALAELAAEREGRTAKVEGQTCLDGTRSGQAVISEQ